jgi:hypothetical protein
MRTYLLIGVALMGFVIGCGVSDQAADDDSQTNATATEEAAVPSANDLARCRSKGGKPFRASGWSGSVAGLSCRQGGRLIQTRFIQAFGRSGLQNSDPRLIRNSDPGAFRSAGFACSSYPLGDGSGWHLICARAGEALSFYLTP